MCYAEGSSEHSRVSCAKFSSRSVSGKVMPLLHSDIEACPEVTSRSVKLPCTAPPQDHVNTELASEFSADPGYSPLKLSSELNS
jgi:hypothetical protein